MQHGADEALLLFVWNRPIKGAEGTTQRPQACFGLPGTVENLGGSLASQGVAASGGAPTWALIKPVGEDFFLRLIQALPLPGRSTKSWLLTAFGIGSHGTLFPAV